MGKGSGDSGCRSALSLYASFDEELSMTIADSFPQLADYCITEDFNRTLEFGDNFPIQCPQCYRSLGDLVAIREVIQAEISQGLCYRCDRTWVSIADKYPQLISLWSQYNNHDAEDVEPKSSLAWLWTCSKGHHWYADPQQADKHGCPGCRERWNDNKLQAHVLGVLLQRQEAITHLEWKEYFSQWGLLHTTRRAQKVDMYVQAMLKHTSKEICYHKQLHFALGDPGEIQYIGDNLNPRAFGGNVIFSRAQRISMWEQAGHQCANQWCQDPRKTIPFADIHIDHIQPLAKNGAARDPNNLQVLCAPCNLRKRDLAPEEWRKREVMAYQRYLRQETA